MKRPPRYSIPREVTTFEKKKPSMPGPTDYEVSRAFQQEKAVSFTRTSRESVPSKFQNKLGPGSYKFRSFLEKRISGAVMFPRSKRKGPVL